MCSSWVPTLSRRGAGDAVLEEGLCLSLRLCLCGSLWRKRGAVSQGGLGQQGHCVLKQGCALSAGEEKGSRAPQGLR